MKTHITNGVIRRALIFIQNEKRIDSVEVCILTDSYKGI